VVPRRTNASTPSHSTIPLLPTTLRGTASTRATQRQWPVVDRLLLPCRRSHALRRASSQASTSLTKYRRTRCVITTEGIPARCTLRTLQPRNRPTSFARTRAVGGRSVSEGAGSERRALTPNRVGSLETFNGLAEGGQSRRGCRPVLKGRMHPALLEPWRTPGGHRRRRTS